MAEPLVALALGFGLGLSLAVPPGAVNALILREATRHGAWKGVRAGLPAPILDTAYMVIVFLGVRMLDGLHGIRTAMAAAGALLMGWLAWDTARPRPQATAPAPASPWAAMLVTLTNPFQYAWWLSAGAAFLASQGLWGGIGFVAAVFGWVLVFSHLAASGATRWPWFGPLMEVVSADLLFTFALLLAATAAGL